MTTRYVQSLWDSVNLGDVHEHTEVVGFEDGEMIVRCDTEHTARFLTLYAEQRGFTFLKDEPQVTRVRFTL